jgi:hypothetical protein
MVIEDANSLSATAYQILSAENVLRVYLLVLSFQNCLGKDALTPIKEIKPLSSSSSAL